MKLRDLWTSKAPKAVAVDAPPTKEALGKQPIEAQLPTAPTTEQDTAGALDAATAAHVGAPAIEAKRLRALGLDPAHKEGPAGLGHSRILDVLGADRFAPVPAVKVDGKVAWFNFALAEELGFPLDGIASMNAMTPALEKTILDALAYRALAAGEDPAGREVVELKADRYGGTGIGNNEGAGRAAFLPWGNLNIKGVGRTPLSKITESEDFHHAHGGAPMREGMVEAVWGEVGVNLFTHGSSRILAIIDVGDFTPWQDGSKEKRALIIRASHQLRPAHALSSIDQGGAFTERVFVAMARELGLLAFKEGKQGPEPDLVATTENMIRQHARAAAEQMRFRVIHGAITTGNMQLDGAQLDLATMSTQPRTANIKMLGHTASYFDEFTRRVEELQRMYAAVSRSLSADYWRAPPVGFWDVADKAFRDELEHQMLDAAGLKPSAAALVHQADRSSTIKLAGAIDFLSRISNQGEDLLADKRVVEASVVDVFAALQHYPAFSFDGAPTREQRVAKVLELLNPRVKGSAETQERVMGWVTKGAERLVDALDAVYAAVEQHGAGEYDSVSAMKRSIAQRAAFENAPIDGLYKSAAHEMFDQVVDAFDRTGDTKVLTDAIDKLAASSVRSFEALLEQGGKRRIDGGLEIEGRSIDGVSYAVRAFDDGARRVHVELPLAGNDKDGYALSTMPGAPRLSRAELEGVRYRFTTDGWANEQEVGARVDADADGKPVLSFDVPVLKGVAARLEGLFFVEARGGFWLKDGASNFRGYTFAVPDQGEAKAIGSSI